MRRFLLLLVCLVFLLPGCGKTKTVTCDHCGTEITLTAGSKITDEWIVFCKECEEALFGETPVVSPG